MNQDSRESIKSGPEKHHPEVRELWCAFAEVLNECGVNLLSIAENWANETKNKLREYGADFEFEALCRSACSAVALAATLKALEVFPVFAATWGSILGPRHQRDRFIKKLNEAADAIDALALAAGVDDGSVFRLWPKRDTAPIPPHKLTRSLRTYAGTLGMVQALTRETEIRSPQDLPRYLITGYVCRATGRWHDREVSAIIAAVGEREDYDENAHKMWRTRNYARLEKYYHGFAELLCAVAAVAEEQR